MTATEWKTAYLALTAQEKAEVLSLLAHKLTICARAISAGPVDRAAALAQLAALNEAQHTVLGQLLALVRKESNGYPDEVFVDGLFELARTSPSRAELGWALNQSLPRHQAINGAVTPA
jgi:hypothetical protein